MGTHSLKEGLAATFKRKNHVKAVVEDHVAATQMTERDPYWLSGPTHLRGEELLPKHRHAGLPLPHSGTTRTWKGACPRFQDAKK